MQPSRRALPLATWLAAATFAACAAPSHRAGEPAAAVLATSSTGAIATTPSTPRTSDGSAAVTRQRPMFSRTAATTAAGTVELEGGLAIDRGTALDTPLLAKYGMASATELFVGWSPYQEFERTGPDAYGSSDVVIGTRHRLWEERDGYPALGLQLAAKAPTASAEIGSGHWDFLAAAMLTGNHDGIAWNAYYQIGALGETGSGVDWQHDVALAVQGGIATGWDWFAELAGRFVPERDVDAIYATAGLVYLVRDHLAFDLGLVNGLTNDAGDVAIVLGFTYNFGRLAGR